MIENVETIRELVALGAKETRAFSVEANGEPIVCIPQNQKIESLDRFIAPRYIRQEVSLHEAESFCEYVNRFKTDNTLIFASITDDTQGVIFKAILDYHEPTAKASRCAHSAKFVAEHTPDWVVWTEHDRKQMDQVEFATFLEDNADLFQKPSGASLLELVKNLHGHRNARFNSAIRLDNGAYSCGYDEDIVVKGSTASKTGELDLPSEIVAGISVFQGSAPYEVRARLKTRIDNRRLLLFYETIQTEKILRQSILELVKQIHTSTSILPLLGHA